MSDGRDVRAALWAMAATAGTGFASGRMVALFFTQTGGAAWVGIAVSAITFGLLTGLFCRWAGRYGADGFPALCGNALRPWAKHVARVMHGLLLTLAAVMMLYRATSLGALTLPFRNARMCGALLAALAALLLNLCGKRPLAWAGLIALALGILFYTALAVDPRPPRIHTSGEVELKLWNDIPAAALLGLLHGTMNAGIAAGVVARRDGCPRPPRVGALCAVMMGVALCCANAAILRGGHPLIAQALPIVLLSARWGMFGFWTCAGFEFLCACCTMGGIIAGIRQ